MASLPEPLIALLKKWHSVPVATAGPDGTPNVAAKSVRVIDPETLAWNELYFMQTYRNLKTHPAASLCAWEWTPPYTAYRVNGHAVIHEHDEVIEQLDKRIWTGHDEGFRRRTEAMAAVVLTVDAVFDQTPRTASAGKRVA